MTCVLAVLACGALLGCSDDKKPNPDGATTKPDGATTKPDGATTKPDGATTKPDGATAFTEQTKVDLALKCTDQGGADPGDETTVEDTVAVTVIASCNYARGAKTFSMGLNNPDPASGTDYNSVEVKIAGFTGLGTYTTDKEGGTTVALRGKGQQGGDTAGGTAEDDSPYKECKIEVTETNLHEVSIPSGSSTTGFIKAKVSCAAVGSSGVGPVDCTVTPGSFVFAIAKCEAAQ